MNRFEASLLVQGYPITTATKDLMLLRSRAAADPLAHRDHASSRIVGHHRRHNPLYRQLLGNRKPNCWEELPVMTKADLQQPLLQRLSTGFPANKVYLNSTSGSSGHPFTFAKDKYAHALTWANLVHSYRHWGIIRGQDLEARFYGMALNPRQARREKLKDFLAARRRFPILDLSESHLDVWLDRFADRPFRLLNGYSSVLSVFAHHLQRRHIVLRDLCPTLQVAVATSEMMTADDRAVMQQWFGVPVANEYGASELDLLGFETPDHVWRVNDLTVRVEILDDRNQPVPDGEPGRVVVTSLYNRAHPFIRYDLGDIGVIDATSVPGHRYWQQLVGRSNDMAVLPSGRKLPGLAFYYATKAAGTDCGINQLVVSQDTLHQFSVTYVADRPLSEDAEQRLRQAMINHLEPAVTLRVQQVDELPRRPSGKLAQFTSQLD